MAADLEGQTLFPWGKGGGTQPERKDKPTKRDLAVLQELREAGEEGINSLHRPGIGAVLGKLWRMGLATREGCLKGGTVYRAKE